MVFLIQVLVANYIQHFGMESPLKLFIFIITYQLGNDHLEAKKNWPGKVLGRDIFRGLTTWKK